MLKKLLLASFALALVSATAAYADTISTYSFTQNSCTGGCGTSPFGTVTVDLSDNGLTATINVTLGATEAFVGTGAGDSLEFNLSGDPAITITNLSPGFEVGPAPDSASGIGSFDYSVTCEFTGGACPHGASGNPPNTLAFVVSSASVLDFTTDSAGYYFSADILGNNGNTGNVAANGAPTVTTVAPEPSSLLLLGTGFLGAAGLLRRRLRKA